MKYLKVWTSFREVIQRLTDSEKGRLFDMMLAYAETGEEPEKYIGNEAFLFPVAKQQIDLAAERAETLRQNGSKGGIAKSKNKQILANDSKSCQSLANDSNDEQKLAVKKRKEKKSNEKESKETLLSEDADDFMSVEDAHGIQSDHDTVLNAAEDAGFIMSNGVRASLIALYADHGLQKVLNGLNSCVKHGAPNLAYLEAVLKGEQRKKPEIKRVTAQQYSQRDYSGEQEEAVERMFRAIKGEGA